MIKVAICDDEHEIASQMERIIWHICEREKISVDTDIFYSGNELEKKIYEKEYYDLVYLDIQMDNGNGITAAEHIRRIDENVLFVYVSGYDQYMQELFPLDVFHFIRKPIEPENFGRIFLDANHKISCRKAYFYYHFGNQEVKLPCMDILYMESRGRKINIHTKEGEIESYNGKLSVAEEMLSSCRVPFLRIHQSYLVNYHYIKSRSKAGIKLTDGTHLPISEDRQKSFGIAYSRLLGSEIDV